MLSQHSGAGSQCGSVIAIKQIGIHWDWVMLGGPVTRLIICSGLRMMLRSHRQLIQRRGKQCSFLCDYAKSGVHLDGLAVWMGTRAAFTLHEEST